MRIIQIGGALAGAQKTIEEAIHSYTLEHGHDSCILYACGTPSMDGEICYESKFENLLTRGLRKYISKHPHFSALQTLRLIRYIKRFKPDIVHLHVLHHGYTDYLMLFKFLAKAEYPIVFTMHDMWAVTGGCYYYTVANCNRYMTGCLDCPVQNALLDCSRKQTNNMWRIKKQVLNQIKNLHIVTVSKWVRNEMQQSFLCNSPITVIPNGVYKRDQETFITLGNHSHAKKRIICVAASWNERKGIDILLELASLLDESYEILIIGGVNESIRARAPKNITFYGYCKDKATLAELYASSDLHVSASREETFGMTFIEAAISGVRSIGFASTAIRETIEYAFGIAVEEQTAVALKNAVQYTLENGLCRLNEDEINTVKEQFSTERMAREYQSLYSEVLGH